MSASPSVAETDLQDVADVASVQSEGKASVKSCLYNCFDGFNSYDAVGSRDSPSSPAGAEHTTAQSPVAAATQAQPDGLVEGLQTQPKHVFVFSSAGKPVFSLHGDENELAGLMATAQALMSVAQSSGQQLKHVRAGSHVVVFLDRDPLYLVAFSALGEPPVVLRMQLSLVHGQLLSLLTASALTSLFRRNPGYDLRRLLSGTDTMLRQLLASFSRSPAAALGAVHSLPLPPPIRSMVSSALAAAVRDSGSLFGLVMAGPRVVTLSHPPSTPLQPWDLLLLQNFLLSTPAFLQAEAFTPLCLPHYNPAANLHAYVHFLHPPTRTAVVLLGGGPPDFHALSAARERMQRGLEAAGTLQALLSLAAAGLTLASGNGQGGVPQTHSSSGGGSVGAAAFSGSGRGSGSSVLSIGCGLPKQVGGGSLGTIPLLHFAYRLSSRQQFVMSPFEPPLDSPALQQAVVVAYSQLRAAMYEGERGAGATGGAAQRLRYEARQRFVLLAAIAPDSELFLTLQPGVDKLRAVSLLDRLGPWLHSRHAELFYS